MLLKILALHPPSALPQPDTPSPTLPRRRRAAAAAAARRLEAPPRRAHLPVPDCGGVCQGDGGPDQGAGAALRHGERPGALRVAGLGLRRVGGDVPPAPLVQVCPTAPLLRCHGAFGPHDGWPLRLMRSASRVAAACLDTGTSAHPSRSCFPPQGAMDKHPRVRWASCQALGQMCTDLGPDLQVPAGQGKAGRAKGLRGWRQPCNLGPHCRRFMQPELDVAIGCLELWLWQAGGSRGNDEFSSWSPPQLACPQPERWACCPRCAGGAPRHGAASAGAPHGRRSQPARAGGAAHRLGQGLGRAAGRLGAGGCSL